MPGLKTSVRPAKTVIVLIGISAVSLAAGSVRGEPALSLLGAVFLLVIGYCALALLAAFLLNRKKLVSFRVTVIPATGTGEKYLRISTSDSPKFIALPPGIVARIRSDSRTRDEKICAQAVPLPAAGTSAEYRLSEPGRGALKRGAYFPVNDAVLLYDAAGFFCIKLPLPVDKTIPRFLIPCETGMPIFPVDPRGGEENRNELVVKKTDELSTNRPYVPGDDTRRINWKLYGRFGDLFIRDGEREPPPHSRTAVIINTQIDGGLYDKEAARRQVDLLCRSALSFAEEESERGNKTTFTFYGYEQKHDTESSYAETLAFPYACDTVHAAPETPPENRVVIFSAPSLFFGSGDLDRFIEKSNPEQKIDIIFLFANNGALREAAQSCAAVYRRGTRVRTFLAETGGDNEN